MESGPCTSESSTQKINVSKVSCGGNTPLHEVVQRVQCSNPEEEQKLDEKHIQNIKMLLKFNPDVNVKNSQGYTSLHLAIKNERSLDVLKYLTLYHKADDLNATDEKGCTALHHAVFPIDFCYVNFQIDFTSTFKFRDVGIVKHLVEKGAKIDTVAKNGYSPLLLAVVLKKTDYVKAMLENSSDLSEGGLEQTASTFCLKKFYYKGFSRLGSKTTVLYPSYEYYKMTPLLITVFDCNNDMAEMLIKAGASVNAVNSKRENALHMLTKGTLRVKNQEQLGQIAKLLIENGIDFNTKDKSGGTALDYAVKYNKHDIVDHILDRELFKY